MRKELEDFFRRSCIEYFDAIAYSEVREINPSLAARSGINAKSVIVFLIPYYAGETDNISIYSASKDYHIIIKKITDSLIEILKELYPENKFRGFGDHSPIDEIGAALSVGLGIAGRNGLIINEKYGSYVFVADVITDIEPDKLGVSSAKPILRCDGCGACARACPTGILRGECGECLSAITQKKGELSPEHIELMKKCGTVWGCDVCQSVCHYNKAPCQTPIDFFREGRIERLTSDAVEAMSDEEFSERAFAWRGRKTVLRNLKHLDM